MGKSKRRGHWKTTQCWYINKVKPHKCTKVEGDAKAPSTCKDLKTMPEMQANLVSATV